jgi:hypothetical protein
MLRKPLPSIHDFWITHVALYIKVFAKSLCELANSSFSGIDENAISEALCPILNRVCFDEWNERHIKIQVPNWEKSIQPVSTAELRGGKAGKRPDFTCAMFNPQAMTNEEYEIPLHIECKVLGKPIRSNWIYNLNYVVNGIMRFDSKEHEYGKRALSGMMIGYIVSMTPEEILEDVKTHLHNNYSGNSCFSLKCSSQISTHHLQSMERQYVKPKDFDIIHIWVDLTKNRDKK